MSNMDEVERVARHNAIVHAALTRQRQRSFPSEMILCEMVCELAAENKRLQSLVEGKMALSLAPINIDSAILPALRAAVEEIESMQASTWASDALDILRRHLAPWLDEDDTLPLSPEAVEAMTEAKKILNQKETP